MPELVLPKFHEGLLKLDGYKTELDQQIQRAAGNPFINRYAKLGMKEGIMSDMAGALGKIHDTVIGAAIPNFIARQIIDVRTTDEVLERFVKEAESVAYVGTENGWVRQAGARYTTVDVNVDITIKDSVEWTKEFAEDAKWNVMNRQLEALGRSMAKQETQKVLAMYDAIAAGDLAGAAEIAGGAAALTWDKLVALWDAVESGDMTADTAFLHPKQMSQLLMDDDFINSNYLPSVGTQLSRGVVGQALTMPLIKSSLCTNGKVYALSKYPAAVMLIRRDVTTEPYEDPKEGKFGVVATERIGLGVLRASAVARGTNFKLTL